MMDESVTMQVQWREKDSLKEILGYRMFFLLDFCAGVIFTIISSLRKLHQ